MNLNLYKYFYYVAKYLSFSKASKIFYISQPALSYSIKTLEEELGYKLFDRSFTGIEFTKEGLNLYEEVKPLIEKFDQLNKI